MINAESEILNFSLYLNEYDALCIDEDRRIRRIELDTSQGLYYAFAQLNDFIIKNLKDSYETIEVIIPEYSYFKQQLERDLMYIITVKTTRKK